MRKRGTAAPRGILLALCLVGAAAFSADVVVLPTDAVVLPAAAAAGTGARHIELSWSSPAADTVIEEAPAELRLRFSGYIERGYTSVTLTGPAGQVATGPAVFIDESDREFTVAIPPLRIPGEYTVHWRTAGADGHVLEGEYAFTLDIDPPEAPVATTPPDTGVPAASAPAGDPHGHGVGHDAAHGSLPAAGTLEAAGRFLHFAALLLLAGGLAFRTLLLPRVAIGTAAVALRRRTWLVMAAGAVVLAVAAVLRLWLQSVALHGTEAAWRSSLLSIMLADTHWGRMWVVQGFAFAVLGAALAWARPARDRGALLVAVPAVVALAAIPALSGHAASADIAWLVVVNDTIHVLAVGAWLGTLFVLLVAALPVLMRHGVPDDAARAVRTFSPIALSAAAVGIVTGALNSLMHIDAPGQLLATDYGRALLVKLGLVALVLLAGLFNWRVVQPRVGSLDGVRRLRLSASAELGLAALVLLVTAVLTGLPRP